MKIISLHGTSATAMLQVFNDVYAQIANNASKQSLANIGAPQHFEVSFSYKGKSVTMYSLSRTQSRVYETITRHMIDDVVIICEDIKHLKTRIVDASYPMHTIVSLSNGIQQAVTDIISAI